MNFSLDFDWHSVASWWIIGFANMNHASSLSHCSHYATAAPCTISRMCAISITLKRMWFPLNSKCSPSILSSIVKRRRRRRRRRCKKGNFCWSWLRVDACARNGCGIRIAVKRDERFKTDVQSFSTEDPVHLCSLSPSIGCWRCTSHTGNCILLVGIVMRHTHSHSFGSDMVANYVPSDYITPMMTLYTFSSSTFVCAMRTRQSVRAEWSAFATSDNDRLTEW